MADGDERPNIHNLRWGISEKAWPSQREHIKFNLQLLKHSSFRILAIAEVYNRLGM